MKRKAKVTRAWMVPKGTYVNDRLAVYGTRSAALRAGWIPEAIIPVEIRPARKPRKVK